MQRAGATSILSRFWFPVAVAGILGALTAVCLWDVFHYDWLRGYDAWHLSRYTDVIQNEHRLPRGTETDNWHNPPLWFTIAALLQAFGSGIGWPNDPHQLVQIFDAFCAVGIAALALLIARELFPHRRGLQIAALALTASTPVLIRGAVNYHPELLATLLYTAALYVLVRALTRRSMTVGTGISLGVLLALANLTRTWALSLVGVVLLALLVYWRLQGDKRALRVAAIALGIFVVATTPWFVFKAERYGSPLAYSQPTPEQWDEGARPLSFYVGFPAGDVFGSPYSPRYLNQLVPVLYSDWWGDFWRYFDVPIEMLNEPETLPKELDDERRIQSFVGILPSLLALGGFVALATLAWRRRWLPLGVVLAALAVTAVSYVLFLVKYPKQDGDNIKALYVLNSVVPLSLCAGFALTWLMGRNRLFGAGIALVLAMLLYYDLRFVVL